MKVSLLLRYLWVAATATTFVAANNVADGIRSDDREAPNRSQPPPRRKNIVLFMTDDQDVTANSIRPDIMPNLHKLFREGGMEFHHYYVSTGLCCPSRATILRGQYCHNTGILDNGDLNNSTYKSGGWSKFLHTGLEDENIATLLQGAGYRTALVGKYMNGYDLNGKNKEKTAGLHKPPGWDHWMGLLRCFAYYGPIFADDGKRVLRTDQSVYQTDFIRDYALDFLKKHHARHPESPFFLMVTPFAPHTPAKPAKRHQHLFKDATFPRSGAYNLPDDLQHQRPAWIKDLPKLDEEQIDAMDDFYRNRLRSLQAVDEALAAIATTLDDLGLADDTYFVYTADNGQHFGDHRIPAGKRQAYETDVLVPFLVRGPGVQKGFVSHQVVQSVDLGPTFLDIASGGRLDSSTGSTTTSSNVASNHHDETKNFDSTSQSRRLIESSYPMDGKSILPLLSSSTTTASSSVSLATGNNGNNRLDPSDSTLNPTNQLYNDFRWAALLEMYSGSSNIGPRYQNMTNYFINKLWPNTYQAIRVVDGPSERTKDQNLLYVEWCTGEQELYNMTVDPHQVHNLLATSGSTEERLTELLPLVRELSHVVAKLGNCTGSKCHELDQRYEYEFVGSTDHPGPADSSSGGDQRRTRSSTAVAAFLETFESIQEAIRNRLPCHNPPGMDPATGQSSSTNNYQLGRKPFAYGLAIPEPFEHGFPFSDADVVDEDLLRLWEEEYSQYFY